jgi:putative molybdenum carrier protein
VGKPTPIEPDWISQEGGPGTRRICSQGSEGKDGRIDDRYNLIGLSTSSYPARTRRNIEKSDSTVIFSLERALNGRTRLTLELANNLGKPVLRTYDTRKERGSNPDSLCPEIQALSDFVCSNKIEILNVAGPRETKEPGVYDWTLKMFRLFLNRTASGAGSTETAGE